MTAFIAAKAPAKLNLFLHITGRRHDGYHLLQSLFVPIALYDNLRFNLNQDGQIKRLTTIADIPEADDLVIKAAHLLRSYAQKPELGVDITLQKVIPSGAGLGGGSSDAATTLLALNKLWQLDLTKEKLLPLALQLGADVPFFLYSQAAIVEGVGEQITPLSPRIANDLAQMHYVLIVPKRHIPTVSIFKDPDLTRDTVQLTVPDLETELLAAKTPWDYGDNDLESVACAQYPDLALMRKFLMDLGVSIRMSGAGSVFFAAFESQKRAEVMQQRVDKALQALASDHALASLQIKTLLVDAVASSSIV